jgi:mannose-6-phosphate isomerase-like protein (cupin superfamily)
MRSCLAETLKMPAPDALILRNAFNDETFIFPNHLDQYNAICFDVALGEDGSGGADGLEHIHPQADETFIVRSGRLKVVIHGEIHMVNERESVTIRRGVPHYFVNGHKGETEFSVIFDPPQQQRGFFANFAAMTERRQRWFSARGKPHLLLMALVLHRYRDHLYVAGQPVWLQKLIFATLAPVARLFGYRLEIEPEG